MNENLNNAKYKINVPYNHPSMVSARKKHKLIVGFCCIFAGLLFAFCSSLATKNNNVELWAILILIGFTVGLLGVGIYFFISIKPLAKDEGKLLVYNFYDQYLEIIQVDNNKQSSKTLKVCLYLKYKDKQFINKIVERNDFIDISIFTGTYNLVPQYEHHFIPKNIFNDTQFVAFKNFLQEIFTKNYVLK